MCEVRYERWIGKATARLVVDRWLTNTLRVSSDADAAAWFAPSALPQRIAFFNAREALAAWSLGDVTPIHLRGARVTLARAIQ